MKNNRMTLSLSFVLAALGGFSGAILGENYVRVAGEGRMIVAESIASGSDQTCIAYDLATGKRVPCEPDRH